MNIRDFEYLITIDELKSFSKASEKCFVSQPALSQQIRKIEDILGFDIFERDKISIITTAKGKKVIQEAKLILNSYRNIKQIDNGKTNLKIGLIPTICPYLLPHIVKKLDKTLPNIKFYFLELKTDELLEELERGEIDVGIIAYFDDLINDKLRYQKLYDEEFLLALPKKSKLDVSDFPKILEDEKLILLEEGNCMSDNIRDICSLYKKSSFNDFYATNIETVKNMLKINNGVALLPKLSCLKEKDLKLLSFKKKKTREIGIVMRNSFSEKKLVKMISEIISQQLEQKNLLN